jgi:prevent-host-death family protein
MEKIVSAADANRKFSELLRGVRKGRSYLVTSHGEPVARIVPAGSAAQVPNRALAALVARLESQPAAKGAKARVKWTRDELYEDAK